MKKLVRDEIPRIIPSTESHLFRFVTLSDLEYAEQLKKKLVEEVEEYLEAENIEELADVYEVLDAIIKFKSFDLGEIHKVKKNKRDQRGGFENRLLMEKIEQ